MPAGDAQRALSPEVDQARCILCGACKNACPRDAVLIRAGRVTFLAEHCDGCGACVPACVLGVVRSASAAG